MKQRIGVTFTIIHKIVIINIMFTTCNLCTNKPILKVTIGMNDIDYCTIYRFFISKYLHTTVLSEILDFILAWIVSLIILIITTLRFCCLHIRSYNVDIIFTDNLLIRCHLLIKCKDAESI